jgi:hypothetical protein
MQNFLFFRPCSCPYLFIGIIYFAIPNKIMQFYPIDDEMHLKRANGWRVSKFQLKIK